LASNLEDPVEGLNKSIVEEEIEELQQQVSHSPVQNQVSVVVEQEEEKQELSPLKKSELSQDELDRLNYLNELDSCKEPQMIENLKYMLEMGYTNFPVNINLLRRNNNDLTIALNLLCNGMVTESMFSK
jgi:hypothetical protein